jgi:hypothetical protein
MRKNFEGVRAKLQERAFRLYPHEHEKQKEYIQAELNKICYYDPKYEKAKAIIEANAMILHPDKEVTVIINGKVQNAREQYILDELAKLMRQVPNPDDMKKIFFEEAVAKYPNFKIDPETGKKKAFEPEDFIIKRMRPTQQSEYVKMRLDAFDFWKSVQMPEPISTAEAPLSLKPTVKPTASKPRGRPPVKKQSESLPKEE